MRKAIFCLFFTLSCASLFSQQYTWEGAAKNAAQEISQKLPMDSTLAVISIESRDTNLTSLIIGFLETELFQKGSLQLVSRQRIQAVMSEQNFGMSGRVDDNSAQRIGRLLGSKYVLVGNIIKYESEDNLHIQVLTTETAIIAYSKIYRIRSNESRSSEQSTVYTPTQQTSSNYTQSSGSYRSEIAFGGFGYNFLPHMPLGFTVGGVLYTSWNFYIPDWQGYEQGGDTYNADNKVSGYGDYLDRGKRAYKAFEWTVGLSIPIVFGILYLPVGLGGNHMKEYRLFDKLDYDGTVDNTYWYGSTDWTSKFVLEAGLQLVFLEALYLSSTLRAYSFKEWSFTIGAGVLFF